MSYWKRIIRGGDPIVRLMSKVNPVLYRFVRFCLNRAYASIDFKKLDADRRYAIDVFVDSIKNSEDSWKSVDDLITFIKNELPNLYKTALTAVPKDILDKLVDSFFNNCLELDEVNTDKKLSATIKEVHDVLKKMEPTSSSAASESPPSY